MITIGKQGRKKWKQITESRISQLGSSTGYCTAGPIDHAGIRKEKKRGEGIRTQVVGVLEALGSNEQHLQRPLRHLAPAPLK
jgi:hypothetical protein